MFFKTILPLGLSEEMLRARDRTRGGIGAPSEHRAPSYNMRLAFVVAAAT